MSDEEAIQIGDRTIEMGNLDRLMFPKAGLTQRDVLDYYRRISETMLPHIRNRPLTMHRFPNGIDEQGFYQRNAPDYFPDWIERVDIYVEEENATRRQLVCNSEAVLGYLVDQGVVTLHTWLSQTDKLDYPDKMIFDLDPPDSEFEPIRIAAEMLHEILEELDLVPFLMTTGSRGLHVVVPLDRSADFDTVRNFARDLAELLAARHPDRLTVAMSKRERGDRLFLDYLRNAYAQSGVAPYAVRALPGAPIATPLDWHELDNRDLNSQSYTMSNLFRRLGQKDDPWKSMMDQARSLMTPRRRLDELRAAAS